METEDILTLGLGIAIPPTPEKLSPFPAPPPEGISGDKGLKNHVGQSFSAGNRIPLMGLPNTVNLNLGLCSSDPTSNGVSICGEKLGDCGKSVQNSGNLGKLSFTELLNLAPNPSTPAGFQPISGSACDGMGGDFSKTRRALFVDHHPAPPKTPQYDGPDQGKDKDEIQCEAEYLKSTSTHRKKHDNGLDFIKRHKPKKKKYWPKIAVEGKKAQKAPKSRMPGSSPPAPKTPNKSTLKRSNLKNRKNTRKKNIEVSANLAEAIESQLASHEHSANLASYEHSAKSCRRVLSFILEAHRRENNDLSNMAIREVTTEQLVQNQGLRVYRRVFKANKCQRNSKLLGPNFPSIFKKRRMDREKTNLHRGQGFARHAIACGRQLFVEMILHTQFQRKAAFGDPKAFLCIFALIPPGNSKKRRSALVRKLANHKHQSVAVGSGGRHSPSNLDNSEHQHVGSRSFMMEGRNNNVEKESFDHNEHQHVGSKNIPMVTSQRCPTQIEDVMSQVRRTIEGVSATPKMSLIKRPIQDVLVTPERSQVQRPQSVTPQKSQVKKKKLATPIRSQVQRPELLTPTRLQLIQHCEIQRLELATSKVTTISSRMLDSIVRDFECCSLNDNGGRQLVVHKQNAHSSPSKHVALVPYDEQFGEIKKRKPKVKVDLDSETMRVWKLLTGNDGREGPKEEDKDKEKWWEDEREIFDGRVHLFISRMHLIQGDRRFSPWKGSVVDSVVGVFLTQNVSDHLSSSAFMSLAAQFPLRSTSDQRACNQQGAAEETMDANGKQSFPNETAHDMSDQLLRQSEDFARTFSVEEETSGVVKDASTVQNFDNSTGGNMSATFMPCTDGTCCCKCDNTAIDNKGLDTQNPGSSSSVLEGACASGHVAGSDNHNSKVPDAPSDMEIECPGLLGGSENKNINTGSMSNNLGKVDKCAPLDDSPMPGESSSQSEGRKEDAMAHTSNNPRGESNMILQSESIMRKGKSKVEENQEKPNWDDLRKTFSSSRAREPTGNATDSLDWEAVRRAPVEVVAESIKERGMNNVLAFRIKEFLDRVVRDHGSLNLEWLREVPEERVKEYLLSIEGLGLKSVECVRLLSLHHHAFPVDTNVGRVAVRLGWVPLQPLPESIQLHLLEQFPVLNSIQKYLWPRLCTLDQRTLYELHYQMITFGKVFCTKKKPNCNACPLRGDCRHFASAFASTRLALPGPQQRSCSNPDFPNSVVSIPPIKMMRPKENLPDSIYKSMNCEPIVEEPDSPVPECRETLEGDIEDLFVESDEEIPTLMLNTEEFRHNIMDYMVKNGISIPGQDVSKALVVLGPDAASIPVPKMKHISRLRTMHRVYELPDQHPLLAGLDKREADDPSPYLLAIWSSGETASSSEPPRKQCECMEAEQCNENTSSCNTIPEQESRTVPGTILIPCRTATRGSFPLNGTYFQVNEVFADDESSQEPINVPREWLWNLPLRTLCCGTSASSIMKGFTTDQIQHVFWRGFICVRGFNRATRVPKRLDFRFHTSASEITKSKTKGKTKPKKKDKTKDKTKSKTKDKKKKPQP